MCLDFVKEVVSKVSDYGNSDDAADTSKRRSQCFIFACRSFCLLSENSVKLLNGSIIVAVMFITLRNRATRNLNLGGLD